MDPELRRRIDAVTAKRPRTVLDHILQHGQITTAELTELYGYNHPPRAARDVREHGIPLKTIRVRGPDGRPIAAYAFDDALKLSQGKPGGRRAFPKSLKTALVTLQGERCALCGRVFPARALQIDHRVPYEVSGEPDASASEPERAFMLVCGSCNRAKSWSCEHCANWLTYQEEDTCKSCMWGSPEGYTHISLSERRSLRLNWEDDEVIEYDELARDAQALDISVEAHVMRLIRAHLETSGEGEL